MKTDKLEEMMLCFTLPTGMGVGIDTAATVDDRVRYH